MKKIYFLLFAWVLSIGAVGAQTTIYAYRTWQESNPTNVKKGPVKFSSATPSVVELIADQSKLGSVYAGTYFNYKWYVQVTKVGTQSSLEGFYTIDMNTGARELISTQGSHLVEMTYDYATSTMYGIKNNAEYLMKLDMQTGETTQIGAFMEGASAVYMLALACDVDGKLYGIATNDNLYLIDKGTAACTLIGSTGVDAAFTQSMDFDRNSGTLYWLNSADYTLYTVDVATGQATSLGAVGENGDDSMTSMFIPYIHVSVGAPDRVTERKAEPQGNQVVLSWKNPSIDAQGNVLSELTGVKIFRDDVLVTTVSVTADKIGEAMDYTDTNLPDGLHSYKLVPVNSKGDGGADSDNLMTYVGNEPPGAVVNFSVSRGDNAAILSWEAPTSGMYGGTFDPTSITGYVITRSDGTNSSTIDVGATQTTYSDTPGFGTYTYSIYAKNNVGKGTEISADPILVKPADWILMETGEAVVESGKTYHFYDIAGPNAYYPNSQNDTLTIRPASPAGLVNVAFTVFSTDTYGDYLYVFDGSSVEAPLIGKFTSYSVPAELKSVESTSADGALTFVFVSDIMSRYEGWEADVTVTEKKQNDLVAESLKGDLYPAAQSEASYKFVVFNKGVNAVEAADYKVKLFDGSNNLLAEVPGEKIESMHSAEFTLAFIPSEAGDMSIYAEIEYAGDDDVSNNRSETLSISVLEEGSQFISVGDHSESILVTPMSFMSNESLTETIYYKDEIGLDGGLLKSLTYSFISVGTAYSNVPVQIWVSETEMEDLDETSIPANEMTLVFDGTISVNTDDEECVFQLATPYNYKGGNLAVLIYKRSAGSTSYDVNFKGTYGQTTDLKRSRFTSTFDDSEVLDPNAVPIGYSAGTIWPDVKLLFTDVASGMTKVVEPGMKVYPNPVSGILNIEGNDIQKVELFNYTGQVMFVSGAVTSIDMASYPVGIYYLKITTNEGLSTVKKIVKN